MKRAFLPFLFLILTQSIFAQPKKERSPAEIRAVIEAVKKHGCIITGHGPDLSAAEQQKVDEFIAFMSLDFKTLDSLFFAEKSEIKILSFMVICDRFPGLITEKHLPILESKEKVKICDRRFEPSKSMTMGEMAANVYIPYEKVEGESPETDYSERKDGIFNEEAHKLYDEAQKLLYKGPVDFNKAIRLLDKADSLEPKNPYILAERASMKFDFQTDVRGSFEDLTKAIEYSLDRSGREMRYHNRGLQYMAIGDIESACEDWHKAGRDGKYYIQTYCKGYDTTIYNNPDHTLKLKLIIRQPSARITKSHNSPQMSSCQAELIIVNVNHPKITILRNNLDYGLESDVSSVYLEAVSEDGHKFRFFTETEYASFGNGNDFNLDKGKVYSESIDITHLHQFPYEGKYKVRLVIRPSANLKGLDKTYYSNWETIEIIQDYQPDDFDGEFYEIMEEER